MSIPDTLYFIEAPAKRGHILSEGSDGIHAMFDDIDAADKAGSLIVKEHIIIAVDMTAIGDATYTENFPEPMTFITPLAGCKGYIKGHIAASSLRQAELVVTHHPEP